jgi:6,7-dimethyl-8-ribityllumazine synthase
MTGGLPVIKLESPRGRFAIVVARFNERVTSALLDGCRETLAKYDVTDDRIVVHAVPGAFELPATARLLAESGRYAAVVCLGCVIRGATDHYVYVAGQAAAGIMQASLATGVPVIFGVLTTDNIEQALERAGPGEQNKGAEAALSAIEMSNLFAQIRDEGKGGFGFAKH